jgi:hypothetical protein
MGISLDTRKHDMLAARGRFGTLGRNTFPGPAFFDNDFSLREGHARKPVARCLVRWLILKLIAGSVSMAQTNSAPRKADSDPIATKHQILPDFEADPSARVFHERLYVYPSHDIVGSKDWDMIDWHVFSISCVLERQVQTVSSRHGEVGSSLREFSEPQDSQVKAYRPRSRPPSPDIRPSSYSRHFFLRRRSEGHGRRS